MTLTRTTLPSAAFTGFPDAKMKPVVVPDLFFSDLLPQIDDLAELKLALHCLWLLNEQSGECASSAATTCAATDVLLAGLSRTATCARRQLILEDALERCTAPQHASAPGDRHRPRSQLRHRRRAGDGRGLVFPQHRQGSPSDGAGAPGAAWRRCNRSSPTRRACASSAPISSVLYEQNIGVLTPLIADQLRDMEKTYAPEWIHDAFEIAVSRNKRHLRYIQNILQRWETEGRDGDQYEESGGNSDRQPAQKLQAR